ncbi:MAG TPA: DUF1146 family protein [Bacillales bacterium]|nr:DUF1146 family protein [Bacillales bacterium]
MFGASPLTQLGVQAILYLVIHLVFLAVTWWALQSFRFDVFMKNPDSPRAKVLLILLTIAIGSLAGNFFYNYLFQSLRLPYLF